jgi:tRNA pseudouridine32 synthase / 23S rRNA pseudouridine746 synthase
VTPDPPAETSVALSDDTPVLLAVSSGWLAVDKPARTVVVPARDEPVDESLWRRLERLRGERLWVVHRLDRDTSGVLLLARSAEAHRALSMAFERHEVAKTYLAFTRGVPETGEGVIDVPLHTARRGHMRPAREGEAGALPSITAWRVMERWSTRAGPVGLLEVRPKSGRSHQVRVHLRWLGCPLLVDPIYGACDRVGAADLWAANLGPADLESADPWAADLGSAGGFELVRIPLHASALSFPDPDTNRPRQVVSPLPADLLGLWRALREGDLGG